MTPLPAPPYTPSPDTEFRPRLGLAVESMRRHVTDEGWQLFAGLQSSGYKLFAQGLPTSCNDVAKIVAKFDPGVVFLQDKREWDGGTAGRGFDDRERFRNVEALRSRPDVFKLTVLKDAHQRPEYHRQSADEIGCHAWVTYYDPSVVCRLAPFVRREHVVRTFHTVDRDAVPDYAVAGRSGCLVSGAVSAAYPLRRRLVDTAPRYGWTVLRHPGYQRGTCRTNEYLVTLSRFKVAVCTASIYQYAVRKIIEATAAGCCVVTDLEEELRFVDGNLHRVRPTDPPSNVAEVIRRLETDYDPAVQEHYADAAKTYYDYRAEGKRLADSIETMRRAYPCS